MTTRPAAGPGLGWVRRLNVIPALQERRRRTDADAAAAVDRVRFMAGRGQRIIRVESIYQRARTGTKAFVLIEIERRRCDAWFEGCYDLQNGEMLVVSGRHDYGPHHKRTNVLYVNEIHGRVPARTLARAGRHQRRIARESSRRR